jgi:branched-chain amino acid transport system permease protein
MPATGPAVAGVASEDRPPVRVTRSRRPQRLTPVVALAAVVVLAAFPAIVGAGTTATLVDVFVLLTMASMWNLLAGYAGLVSIGQQTFIGLGAYIVLVLAQWGMQPYLALPLAAIGSALAALPISWLLLRLRGGYFAIATWVVADAVQLTLSRFPSLGGGTGAILPGASGIDPSTRLAWTYWAALAVAVLTLATVYLVLRGRLGLVLTAVRDNEIGARSVGADVGSAKRTVFLVAAAGCGAAGGLLLLSQLNVLSTSVFSVSWSAKMIFVVIIGGIGSIEGPIVGTAIYFALQTGLAQYGAWYFIVLGVVAIVIALWAPRGVWGAIAGRINLHPFPTGYWLWTTEAAGSGGPAAEAQAAAAAADVPQPGATIDG